MVADRLGYQADPIARALASGRTGYVGVLCGSLQDGWQQGVAAALGRELLGHDRHALIVDASNSPDLERMLANQLVDQRVDALIVLWVDPSGEHWAEIAERTVLVSIGDGLPGAATAAEVVFDNDTGVTEALGLLAAAGHKRIAVLSPSSDDTPATPAELAVRRVSNRLGRTGHDHPVPARPRRRDLGRHRHAVGRPPAHRVLLPGRLDGLRRLRGRRPARAAHPRRHLGAGLRRPPRVARAAPAAVELPVAGGRAGELRRRAHGTCGGREPAVAAQARRAGRRSRAVRSAVPVGNLGLNPVAVQPRSVPWTSP